MESHTSPVAAGARRTGRALWLVAALLLLGGILTIGSLWLPWHHYRVPPGTTYISPEDLAPYVPITEGLAHSFTVFSAAAIAAGAVGWATAARQGGPAVQPLALGCVLCACAGTLFATVGIDGAMMAWPSEATEYGYFVSFAGYIALAAAGVLLLATSLRVSRNGAGSRRFAGGRR
jgi:hypothetical protein